MESPKNISKEIKILIADDEALARKRIVKFLAESVVNSIVYEASNGKEAIKVLNEFRPDIVFLDIKMTDMSGFDVLRQVRSENIPIVIFVTAFDDFAVKAFEVRAIDFLLKPYRKERFTQALERGIDQLELEQRIKFQSKVTQFMEFLNEEELIGDTSKKNYLESVVLKKNKKYYFVKTCDISYIKSSGYYAEIYTMSGNKHLHRISMSLFINQLDPKSFSRVNRSTIVPMGNIKEVISEGLGGYSLRMMDGTTFPVGKNYKVDILDKMGIR